MKRFLWLGFVLFVYLICTGCGDTFRPIIIPNPPTFPNPRAAHSVVAINDNGTATPGSTMVIDVSGDTDVSVKDVGLAPVHAVQQTANQVLVVNHSVTGAQGDSITKLNFNGTVISSATTISLPPNSAPGFVAVAPNQATAYVTLPNLNAVGVVNTISNSAGTPIPVGSNPYALAVTPDNSKLYVANNSSPCKNPLTPGVCSISSFNIVNAGNTVNLSPREGSPVSTSSPPVWLVARSDSQAVYVLEASGTLAYISIISTTGPDVLTETTINVPGAVKMVYDSNLNRLYIPGGSQVVIVDVSQAAPSTMTTQTITPTTPSGCSAIGAATLYTVDVAALPDGTRAYVGSYYEDANNNICPQVTAIDAGNYSQTTIAVPGFPAYDDFCSPTSTSRHARFRIMMAAGGDSSRAYLFSCDGGNVNIIDTSNDTYIENLAAPAGSRLNNPPQNPVFLFAGP
jgi:DNA-binding beta-propeller fold protein YncE